MDAKFVIVHPNIMTKNSCLSIIEQGKIITFQEANMMVLKLQNKLENQTLVNNFQKDLGEYCTTTQAGRPKLTFRWERDIWWAINISPYQSKD